MSASSLSFPFFLEKNLSYFLSFFYSNRLTEHIRLTHTESFAEWQKADAGCTSDAFKHPGHDVTRTWRLAVNFVTDYTYDSELDIADGIPRSVSTQLHVPRGEAQLFCFA